MKYYKTLLALPLLLWLASCTQNKAATQKATDVVIPVKVLLLAPQKGPGTIQASGQFTTEDEVYLSFKTGGVIERIYVNEGDAIHTGQLLAVLKLTEIDAQVQQANLAYEKAARDHERTANLYKDSVATLEQLQNSKTMADVAKQQLDAAKFNRNYSEIRATRDGYLLRKMANEGQLVGSGTPVFQANGANSSSWLLRVNVSDKQWAAININDKATASTDVGNGKMYEGVIIHKSQGVDPASGMLTVDVQLNGKKPEDIAYGMFGKATINCEQGKTSNATTTWSVPYQALLDADGSMGYLFVVNDNNTVSKVKVTIQGMDKDYVIISDGLQQAKAIVTSGNAYLTDNSIIRIIQ